MIELLLKYIFVHFWYELMITHVQIGLTEKIVKELQDKSLEKRSNAAKLVQNDIEECVSKNDYNAI